MCSLSPLGMAIIPRHSSLSGLAANPRAFLLADLIFQAGHGLLSGFYNDFITGSARFRVSYAFSLLFLFRFVHCLDS
jgi:hypothetical protein